MRILSLTAAVLLVSSLSAPARAGMVEVCKQHRDTDLRIEACTAVIGSTLWQGKDISWTYYNRGFAYAELGDYRRAIGDYDQALQIDLYVAEVNYNRGLAYYYLGEYHRAIEDYDRALRLKSGYTKAYYNRGNAYLDLGEYHRAIEDYDRALRLRSGYAGAYRGRANARCHLEMIETSLDDRMQALRLGEITAENTQRHLRDRGFYKGAIDGDFGSASRRALRDWTAAGCP